MQILQLKTSFEYLCIRFFQSSSGKMTIKVGRLGSS